MLKVVIVDDEPDAVKFIGGIIAEYCPNLEVLGTANSAREGVSVITQSHPDLVFLDVQMPHGSGFDLLSAFPEKKFDVIFITAYNHYAIQAIKFSAVDYILKPVDPEKLAEGPRKSEDSPRSRKPLGEVAFRDSYGSAWE